MSKPEIALSITTFQKPWHLRRSLASIAGQRGVEGKMEVVVTDDGSTDETQEIVEEFRRRVPFPVKFTTHEHTVYHPSRSRNDGARATTAPYLLFIDGDCVLPPDHVAVHLAQRKPGVAMLGDCHRADQALSATLSEEGAERGEFLQWRIPRERWRLHHRHIKHQLYTLLRHPTKPRLVSNNVGIWRSDFERVNGFDENFQNWGCEDDDLGRRLRRAGVRLESILPHTRLVHLWHPRDPSTTSQWHDGANVDYFLRPRWLTRCRNGLTRRSLADLNIQIVGQPADPEQAATLLHQTFSRLPAAGVQAQPGGPDCQYFSPLPAAGEGPGVRGKLPTDLAVCNAAPEIEILFLPGEGQFSGKAEFNILVLLDDSPVTPSIAITAQRIIANAPLANCRRNIQFPLADFARALDSIA